MAWIESHQDLKDHPKTCDLMAAMGWDLDTTIGKLHRFWWWCVDYAEDGDLRKHNDNRIAQAMGVATPDAGKLVKCMVSAGWLDREPFFRVHDWWDHIGLFLQRKYGGKNPEKWQQIRELYTSCTPSVREAVHQVAQPNQPNLTNQDTDNAREVELPHGFPKSEAEAKEAASFVGCTEDFAVETWNKAMSRSGRDAKDIPIRSWRHYLKTEMNFDQNRKAQPQRNNAINRQSQPDRNAGTYNSEPLTDAAKAKVR